MGNLGWPGQWVQQLGLRVFGALEILIYYLRLVLSHVVLLLVLGHAVSVRTDQPLLRVDSAQVLVVQDHGILIEQRRLL